MDYSKTLPSMMCTGCMFYTFNKNSNAPHRCANTLSSNGKTGQDPDKKGTAGTCKAFKPR